MAKAAVHIFSPSKNKTYYYYTEGEKRNPALCIIPGFTGLHDDQLVLARQFRNKYFVIVPELPGWGKSSPLSSSMTIVHYADFLRELFTFLGIAKIILIGHCMGAVIALEFSLRFPEMVQQVFVVSTPYQEGLITKTIFSQLVHMSLHTPRRFRPLFYFWRSRIFNMPFQFLVIQSRSLRKKIKLILRIIPMQSAEREQSVEENWASLMEFSFEKIKNISVPVHIIHGAKDYVIPLGQAEKLHALLPEATFDIIPSSGHLPPIETPIALAHLIWKYL